MNPGAAIEVDFRAITDDGAGDLLPEIFAEYWPAYRKWMRRAQTSDTDRCVAQLAEHMPELMPAFDSLRDRCGDDDEVARFLTLYDPPPVVRACSQLVVQAAAGPVLLRTYDHHPDLFDAIVLASAWHGTSTLAVTDCLWGALDGINAHGLAVALAFGGRPARGHGFAAPLIVRYLLETCASASQAHTALARLPVHMPYTFVVIDATGEFITAFLGPDRPARFLRRRCSTNHQGRVEWPAYATHVKSVQRLKFLEALIKQQRPIADVERCFLGPPLWRDDYAHASGTLYACLHQPVDRSMRLCWPGHTKQFDVGDVIDESFTIRLADAAGVSHRKDGFTALVAPEDARQVADDSDSHGDAVLD